MEVAESSNQLQPANMEEIEVQLDDNVPEAAKLAKHTLVGRILAAKSLNRNAVKEILSKAWNVQEEINISDLGPNIFLFNFSDRKIATRVLKRGHGLLWGIYSAYNTGFQKPQSDDLQECYKACSQCRGSPVRGKPYLNGTLIRPFFRVRVLVNVKKPLITGFWVPRKDLPRTRVMVRYEKLQGFYYSCGIIGHDKRKCDKEPIMTIFDPSRPKYSSQLGVPPARSLTTIVTKNLNRVKKLRGQEDDDVATKDKAGTQHHPQSQKHLIPTQGGVNLSTRDKGTTTTSISHNQPCSSFSKNNGPHKSDMSPA
ncbi:Zinc knuckle CX2CX4HX4C [Sesbania bispinosa]|nr:Zinc knuckle CX2CX4HX4C [Sesbania bispinosa]